MGRAGCHGCRPRPVLAEKATSPCKLVFIFLVGSVQIMEGEPHSCPLHKTGETDDEQDDSRVKSHS